MTSGVVLCVAGWIFSREIFSGDWPCAMAVVGLAFLRVNQDFISVVDLVIA